MGELITPHRSYRMTELSQHHHDVDRASSPTAWLSHRWAAPAALSACAVAMLIWTWGKYCDPFVDFGRELYVAWRLSAGDVLYRDIDYFNGPISPYLNALIFKLFGASLRTLEIANLFWWTLIVAMSYRLYVAISDRLSAFIATLLFIALFSFLQFTGTGNYNFVTPYAHEMTHSLCCALAVLTLLGSMLRDTARRYPPSLAGCGLLLGTIFLMKVEVTMATAAALGAGIALRLVMMRARPRQWLRTLAILIVSAMVPSLIAFLLLRIAMPAREAFSGLLGAWKYLFDARIAGNEFYRRVTGTDKLAVNTRVMVEMLGCDLLLLGPPAVLAALIRRKASGETRWVAAGTAAGYVLVLLWVVWDVYDWRECMRPLNFIATASLLAFTVQVIRQRANLNARLILQVSFSVFATALLAKIFFRTVIYHYGFALAGPAFALLVMLLFLWIPKVIRQVGGSGWVFRAAAFTALGGFCFKHLISYQDTGGSLPVQTVGSGTDQFDVYQGAESINQVLNFLAHQPKEQTLAAVPQGAMINYLARRINPTGELTLLPGEVAMFGERRIEERFRSHPPDWILAVQTDVAEFGYKGFGVDYAQGTSKFIKENYKPVPFAELDGTNSKMRLFGLSPQPTLIRPPATQPAS